MKNKKIYLLLLILGIGLTALEFKAQMTKGGVTKGPVTLTAEELPSEWDDVIAQNVNDARINLFVDSKEISLGRKDINMDAQMNIMIPADIFTDTFQCSFNSYDNDHIMIQRGNTVVKAQIGTDYIVVNGECIQMQQAMNYVDGTVYVNASLMEKGFKYSVKWDIGHNTLFMSDSTKGEKTIPSKFSYREIYKIPGIKNQGNLSTCWAFASLTALETSLMPKERFTFSVDNMSFNNGYIGPQTDGGDYIRAMAYLSAWRGPVLESDDPYGDGVYSTTAKPVKHVQEIQLIESKNFDNIKKSVFMYGGVQSSLYTSMASSSESSVYYNRNNSSYCYIGTQKPNHDVVIVGWDDYYSKSNFNGNLEGDGAFICMNSWGDTFGDGGLFYVSYYDSNIGMHNVVYTRVEENNNYDNIYQTDICGWVGKMGYESDTAYFSNIYTAKNNETLEAVSFYATDKNTEYEVWYVEDFKEPSSFDEKVFLKKGSFRNAGYYTVQLDKEVALQSGRQYGIIIKIKTPYSVHPIAVEYRAGAPTAEVDLDDGCGYISLTGRSWEHVEESKNCNICLKMFTNDRKQQ